MLGMTQCAHHNSPQVKGYNESGTSFVHRFKLKPEEIEWQLRHAWSLRSSSRSHLM